MDVLVNAALKAPAPTSTVVFGEFSREPSLACFSCHDSMIHIFALGAAGGLLCGILKQKLFPVDELELPATDTGSIPMPEPSTSGRDDQPRCRWTWQALTAGRLVAAGGVLACACAAAGACILFKHHRQGRGRGSKHRQHKDGRIPLQDLIRFKERQWFVEELENARDADPNAMLRLAKMYLHGQGCQRNIAMAQEWVRKARSMGVPATLDELFATDDPDARGKLRSLAAQEERRRALRRSNPNAAYPPQRQQHTAAA